VEKVAPPIALTCRPMFGTRLQRSGRVGRGYALLLSVLALALACSPAVAQAIPPDYEEGIPTPDGQPKTGHESPANSSNLNGGATAPSNSGGSTGSGSSGSSGGSSSDSSSRDGEGGGAAGSGGDYGQGSPGLAAAGGIDPAKKLSQANVTTSGEEGDGGSSPLVPILIAIAVLAATSIGALLVRQRRQRGGSLSPEAS